MRNTITDWVYHKPFRIGVRNPQILGGTPLKITRHTCIPFCVAAFVGVIATS
jgi:hypothetical protein